MSRRAQSDRPPARQSVADARAEAERSQAARREALDDALSEHFAAGVPGTSIMAMALWPTVGFVVLAILAVVVGGPTLYATAVYDVVLFAAGLVLFVLAIYSGTQRSRVADLTMSGWFFLIGAAPSSVRRLFLGCLVAQVSVSLMTAALRPFTALAFGVLVPIYGLAITAVWSARFGYFPPRVEGDPLVGGDSR